MQKDLDELQKWEANWSMSFIPEKCQLLRVTKKKKQIITNYLIHGKNLNQTDNAKYLGVINQSINGSFCLERQWMRPHSISYL